MKRVLTIAGSLLLILSAICCTMGALITAFSFNVDILALIPVWMFAALALSIAAAIGHGKGVLILTPPVLIILVLRISEVLEGGKWVIYSITTEYNKWLHVPVIFPSADASLYDVTQFFTVMGIILAVLLSISVCLQKSAFLTMFFTMPTIFLTVVLTESTPDVRYFLGLMAVYLTMIISTSLHPDNYIKRGRSIFPALALALMLLVAAYLIAPPDDYRRNNFVDDIDYYLRNTADRLGLEMNKSGVGWPDMFSGEWRFNTESVWVADAGSRTITDRSVLEITASQAGTYYLRGFSMVRFNGREWRGSSDTLQLVDEDRAIEMPALIAGSYKMRYPDSGPDAASMTIGRTGDSSDIIYRPYYSVLPSPYRIIGDPYTVEFYHTEDSILGLYELMGASENSLSGFNVLMQPPSTYTQIEDSTAEGLRQIALDAGIDPNADRAVVSDMVAEYISSIGRYTLTPYVIPHGEDFALYFLQTSRRGYCIHFATVATLMLRALDIPARFTSGFAITVPPANVGQTVVVTDRHAHAWVEVYYEDVGWLPLEVTPSSVGSGVPERGSHSAAVSEPPATPDDIDTTREPFDDMFPEDLLDPDRSVDASPMPESDTQTDGSQQQGVAWRPSREVLIAAICVVAFAIAIALRRTIACKHRKKRFAQPDTNAAVIYAWRYVSRVNRREKPPKELEEIALKARFSQHRITEEERTAMIDKVTELSTAANKSHSFPIRLWRKFIQGY